MIRSFSFSELTPLLNATHKGDDVSFTGVSIDTRTIKRGEVFVAIAGEHFDGHDYAVTAQKQGAVGLVVEHFVDNITIPQLKVSDARYALGQLGALNRQLFKGVVIAVTGSSGKTTVKEFVATILSKKGSVLATQGNLNNELGVPLTLLQLTDSHEMAVIEMGASAVGEIAYSVQLVRPHVALINNASEAHIGKFGGLENIVKAKGEILEGLQEQGTAILNLDDPAFDTWKQRAGEHTVLSFSRFKAEADFYAVNFERNRNGCQSFLLHTPKGEVAIELNVLGQHNVSNASAAAAVAYAVGLDLKTIQQGLNSLLSVKGRTNTLLALGGARVIDDTYNASPASVKAAIDLLSEFAGRKVLVLGDMGELGAWAETIHQDIGRYAQGKVDAFYAVGSLMRLAVDAFGSKARYFDSKEALTNALREEDDVNVVILVKGSRSMGMESVISILCGSSEGIH